MLQTFTRETFEPRLNQQFQVMTVEEKVVLELVECGSPAESPASGSDFRQPFSLIFQGPAEPLLPQQIYRLLNAELGEMDLFLVPIGVAEQRARYEVVFG